VTPLSAAAAGPAEAGFPSRSRSSAAPSSSHPALAMAGDLKGAIAAFERALESDPENQTARQNLARARAEAKNP
jgi:Tfp pilus assembly protein PilF